MKRKSILILTTIIVSLFLIVPTTAKNPWIKDEKNDWYDSHDTTWPPVEGVDWLDIKKSAITKFGENLVLRIQVKTNIKAEERADFAAFWWSFDLDKDPDTGISFDFLGTLGYDSGVRVKYLMVDEAWTWTAVFQEYPEEGEMIQTDLDTFYIIGSTVTVLLPHSYIDYDEDFIWTTDTNDYHYGNHYSGYIDNGMETYAEF